MAKKERNWPEGVAIAGPGRVGQALGKLLLERGVPVRFIAARKLARARQAARFIGGGQAIRLRDPALGDAAVILLAVSDGAIAPVARALAALQDGWAGRIVLHTCGSLGASALEPFRRRGAAVGSLHPYQTIPDPSAGAKSLTGTFWAIEGDAKAEELARRWVAKLGGTAFRVRPGSKGLYHLSAFLVCPTLVTLMHQSEKLLQKASVPPRAIRPMLEQFAGETLKNYAKLGARKALTGPASRGDWVTIRKHVAELWRASPEALPAYRELVRLMAKLAGRPVPSGSLDVSRGGSPIGRRRVR